MDDPHAQPDGRLVLRAWLWLGAPLAAGPSTGRAAVRWCLTGLDPQAGCAAPEAAQAHPGPSVRPSIRPPVAANMGGACGPQARSQVHSLSPVGPRETRLSDLDSERMCLSKHQEWNACLPFGSDGGSLALLLTGAVQGQERWVHVHTPQRWVLSDGRGCGWNQGVLKRELFFRIDLWEQMRKRPISCLPRATRTSASSKHPITRFVVTLPIRKRRCFDLDSSFKKVLLRLVMFALPLHPASRLVLRCQCCKET